MLKSTAFLIALLVIPQIASAADLRAVKKHHPVASVTEQDAELNRVYHCTNHHVFGLYTWGTCDGVFDPMSVSPL